MLVCIAWTAFKPTNGLTDQRATGYNHPYREHNMTAALILMGAMGLVISTVLALASKVFYVYVDPKIEDVEDALPGAN
jgi:hypothetical protein